MGVSTIEYYYFLLEIFHLNNFMTSSLSDDPPRRKGFEDVDWAITSQVLRSNEWSSESYKKLAISSNVLSHWEGVERKRKALSTNHLRLESSTEKGRIFMCSPTPHNILSRWNPMGWWYILVRRHCCVIIQSGNSSSMYRVIQNYQINSTKHF